ncbi:hypothetical protein [Shimia biformata]|uniref:hypothetical protein n=1 Tax=Shimia biformata TaxID=1294299 RepID=UPI001951DA9B|nr:hypothetical protein [Shimia biformata]
MTHPRWHIRRQDATLTLARRPVARLDVSACTSLPDAGRLRVAQQVRQDMWRVLQDLKGFSPVVEVTREAGGLTVTAGGEVSGQFPRAHVEGLIREVLECPERRARWLRHARHRRNGDNRGNRGGQNV